MAEFTTEREQKGNIISTTVKFDDVATYTFKINLLNPLVFMLSIYNEKLQKLERKGKSTEEVTLKLLKSLYSIVGGDEVVFELQTFMQDNDYDFELEDLITLIIESLSIEEDEEVETKEKKSSKKG